MPSANTQMSSLSWKIRFRPSRDQSDAMMLLPSDFIKSCSDPVSRNTVGQWLTDSS